MNVAVGGIVAAIALGATPTTRHRLAVDMVMLGSKLRAVALEPHWRWSVWLAAAITITRIDDDCN